MDVIMDIIMDVIMVYNGVLMETRFADGVQPTRPFILHLTHHHGIFDRPPDGVTGINVIMML